MKTPSSRVILLVVAAPSGCGKTTLCERLRGDVPRMSYSVSCTTRAPRDGEVDGVDYHFLSATAFGEREQHGDFLEHATVHGYRYGTLRAGVERLLADKRHVLMDIDVQGAAQVRAQTRHSEAGILGAALVDVFVLPPSMTALEMRLRRRGKDDDATMAVRLRNAASEMARRGEFMYCIVNDDLEAAYAELLGIVAVETGRGSTS